MNSIIEYTMEMQFLNLLLKKDLLSKPEYNRVREKIITDYRINTGVDNSKPKEI